MSRGNDNEMFHRGQQFFFSTRKDLADRLNAYLEAVRLHAAPIGIGRTDAIRALLIAGLEDEERRLGISKPRKDAK
jgi:hypothetical protein